MRHPKLTLVGPLTWGGVSNYDELQLGLLSLAAILQPHGINPQIVDLNLITDQSIEDEAVATILDTDPDLVGFGSICSSYPLTLRLAAAIKRERPSVTVILGGPQASVVDRPTMLAFPAIDFVVRGEAERSFPELLTALSDGGPIARISGITYRRDRRILRNPNAPVINDLDELPLPLYDYYSNLRRRTALPLEAGRGCPFACRFCSTNDFFRRKFRLKSAAKLVSEMMLLSGRYGIREFQLTHDMFTVDRKRVVGFCEELLKQDVALQWRCSARTDCVDPELLELMARAGCSGIFFGIETGSQRLQQVVQKDLDLTAARKILQTVDSLGIHSTASLITGYPQEQLEDLDGTVKFFGEAIRLESCDPQLHLLSPLAETPLATEFREQLSYDRIVSDVSGDREYLHPVDELLVLAHPDIFPNFYALPCPIDREYLQHLRAFLLTLSTRAKGLSLALHSECGGLRAVYEAWRATCPTTPSIASYKTWEFFEDILKFIGSQYTGRGRIGVEVMHRFYAALTAEARRSEDISRSQFPTSRVNETHVRLARNMRLVSIQGDVIGVLSALRNAVAPDATSGDRAYTLAVEIAEHGNNRILELPPLSATILSACRQTICLTALAECLAGTGIARRLADAIQVLHRQGLLDVLHPVVDPLNIPAARVLTSVPEHAAQSLIA